jgi:protein-tyrosine kinase
MSQIHEALKRAARERSALPDAGWEPAIVAVANEIQQPPVTEQRIAKTADQGAVRIDISPESNSAYRDLVLRCAHVDWRVDPRESVFQDGNTRNGAAERFRILRSRLYQTAATRKLRRVLVTSSAAMEGKTFVAFNLAQSIVQQPNRRVLLVDADLRAPRLHKCFGAPRSPGLAEYLQGRAEVWDVLQQGEQENLCLLPAGRELSKPSEFLLSDRMKSLLERVEPLFDWIIIDSPPALPVHDASDLAELSDGVVLVLRAGATRLDAVEKAAAEFKNKHLLGVVLNQVEKGDSYGDYYYSPGQSLDASAAS